MTIAVIPARGGSKRIPGKNIKEFAGRPIIEYAIVAATRAGIFDAVVVSTDDETIADAAVNCGCTDVVKRPEELAGDMTPLMPVIKDALIQLDSSAQQVCAILPTAVFLEPRDLIESLQVFKQSSQSFLVPVIPFDYPVGRALSMQDGRIDMHVKENLLARSQDLETLYHDTGTFYWCRPDALVNNEHLFNNNTAPYLFDRRRAIDIDTPEDWEYAEYIYTHAKR